MESTALVAFLQTSRPGAQVEAVPRTDLHTTVYVERDDLPAFARLLCDHPDFRLRLLVELTAVDYLPREPRFELVYLLVSIERGHRVRLKVRLPGTDPHIETVSGVWPAANWLEREVWDLFGIAFDGHPDPRRLLMPEDWDGYPLRKDYPVQIRMTPTTTEATQVTEEEFRANVQRDRLTRERRS